MPACASCLSYVGLGPTAVILCTAICVGLHSQFTTGGVNQALLLTD